MRSRASRSLPSYGTLLGQWGYPRDLRQCCDPWRGSETDVANPNKTHVQDLSPGDTVEIGKGYDTGKGKSGRVYRYIGSGDHPFDLSAEDYTVTATWQLVDKLKVSTLVAGFRWVVLAPDGASFVLE